MFHEQAELNGELEENEGFIRNNKHHYLLNIGQKAKQEGLQRKWYIWKQIKGIW